MVAASRNLAPPPTRKRKARPKPQPSGGEPPKKKSPLFDKPQNFYAPPAVGSMTKDELMAWRKEQRRKRNRESAAASRNKQRVRITELEGEVARWRSLCRDMQARMRALERHVAVLTRLDEGGRQDVGEAGSLGPPRALAAVVSHPASPSQSPVHRGDSRVPSPALLTPSTFAVPTAVTSSVPLLPAFSSHPTPHLFPALLSDPKDPSSAKTRETAAVTASSEDSRMRLSPISRHAKSS